MAFERDVKWIAQDVPGVAFVNPEARKLRLMHQDPADMAPEETGERTVRVRLLVGELMVPAMDRDPARGRVLQAGHRDDRKSMLQPFGTFQAAVGQQPVIAKVDAEQPAQMGGDQRHGKTAPAESAGHEGQQRHGVPGADHDYVGPVELKRRYPRGQPQPLLRCDGNGIVGQHRGLQMECRHAGPVFQSLRKTQRSVRTAQFGYGDESQNRYKPLTEFVYFSWIGQKSVPPDWLTFHRAMA